MVELTTVHATCVALEGKGVLLRGPSGVGKSDLALRLIEGGGTLVGDDQIILTKRDKNIFASAPASLAGLMEVRGVGICIFEFLACCELALIVDVNTGCTPERMPDLKNQGSKVLGTDIPNFELDPFHASASAKINAMLKLIVQNQT